MAATIDTLGIAKRWRAATTEEERAEVLANSLRELQQLQLAELATKSDLALLRSELPLLESRLEAKIEASQNTILKWLVTLLIAQGGLVVAIIKLL